MRALIFVVVIMFSVSAHAQWEASGHLGYSFFVDSEVAEDAKGDSALVLTGRLKRVINESVGIGAHLSWESHGVELESFDLDVGDTTTVTVAPYIELISHLEQVSLFGSLGIGLNINSLDNEDSYCTAVFGADCESDVDNTLALLIDLGIRHYFHNQAFIQGMFSWRMNDGDFETTGGGGTIEGDFNMNTIQLSAGAGFSF